MQKPLYVLWLRACLCAVFLMVAIGGYTRLSGAGLSIVEWKPLVGAIPPLSTSAWQEEFVKYQASPEFQKVNFDMTLSEFQWIYFVEYFHRLVGRLVGILFFIPLVLFWRQGTFSGVQKRRFMGISLLGALQGFMGWYMVKSGLIHEPMVSPIRLTGHLLLAVCILSLLYWELLETLAKRSVQKSTSADHCFSFWVLCLGFLTLVYGGLVAGHKAGLVYNTFPLMEGHLFPIHEWRPELGLLNLYQNPVVVQFIHRVLAVTLFVMGGFLSVRLLKRPSGELFWPAVTLVVGLCAQVTLGILTLLFYVPLSYALLHQLMGIIVFMLLLRAYFKVYKG